MNNGNDYKGYLTFTTIHCHQVTAAVGGGGGGRKMVKHSLTTINTKTNNK